MTEKQKPKARVSNLGHHLGKGRPKKPAGRGRKIVSMSIYSHHLEVLDSLTLYFGSRAEAFRQVIMHYVATRGLEKIAAFEREALGIIQDQLVRENAEKEVRIAKRDNEISDLEERINQATKPDDISPRKNRV